MGFWIFMFCCDLLIPLVMIFAGRMMQYHPPREINFVLGYRTARSMKNRETWVLPIGNAAGFGSGGAGWS